MFILFEFKLCELISNRFTLKKIKINHYSIGIVEVISSIIHSQNLGKVFLKGFYKKTDKDGNVFLDEKGNPVYFKRRLDAGELAERLDIYLQQRLRYNLLKLCVELDLHPIDPDFLKN